MLSVKNSVGTADYEFEEKMPNSERKTRVLALLEA